MSEERKSCLRQYDDQECQHRRETEQRVEGQRSADAVGREPADAAHDGHERGGHDVAAVTEAEAAQNHLRYPVQRAASGEGVMSEGTEEVAQRHRGEGLPEAETEVQHRQDPDEDRRELEVGRGPRPEHAARFAVPGLERDELVAAWFDRKHFAAIRAGRRVGDGLCSGSGRCHCVTVPYLRVRRQPTERPLAWCPGRANCRPVGRLSDRWFISDGRPVDAA